MKTKIPKKPTTKRDKHFYDMGAKQQAKVFHGLNTAYEEANNGHLEGQIMATTKDWSKFSPRKELLNDYQEPIADYKINWTVITLLILCLLAFLYAMHGDQQALNAGLIH